MKMKDAKTKGQLIAVVAFENGWTRHYEEWLAAWIDKAISEESDPLTAEWRRLRDRAYSRQREAENKLYAIRVAAQEAVSAHRNDYDGEFGPVFWEGMNVVLKAIEAAHEGDRLTNSFGTTFPTPTCEFEAEVVRDSVTGAEIVRCAKCHAAPTFVQRGAIPDPEIRRVADRAARREHVEKQAKNSAVEKGHGLYQLTLQEIAHGICHSPDPNALCSSYYERRADWCGSCLAREVLAAVDSDPVPKP